jgi:CPA2 family monovalent cation:H+ antiporter-2
VLVAAAAEDGARVLIELGVVVLALGVLARVSRRVGISAIPFYLVAGLAVGEGGLVDLDLSQDFIELGAEIGVILLLLTLGLEYTPDDLRAGLRSGLPSGVLDAVANFTPGFLLGVVLGWDVRAALLLGGVTYISSSGIVAKVLGELGRLGNRETPAVLSILVIEDLAMAAYLPVIAVLLIGEGFLTGAASVAIALAVVTVILWVALRHGTIVSRLVASPSDEALLLSVLGMALVVAGIAEQLDVSAAIGAFLVGIAVSGPVSERARTLITPLRDLFAGMFFLFFGLQVDPATLPGVAVLAIGLGLVTAATKFVTGWYGAGRLGVGRPGRIQAGTILVARGEFSIVIAGLGVSAGVEGDLGPLAAAYVLLLAAAAPVIARYGGARTEPSAARTDRR